MAGYYYGNPYAGMYAQPAPAAAPVMGFPVGAGGGPPADQLLQPGSAAHLLGELWALEEADFAAQRIETPRAGPGGLFGLGGAGFHPALAALMAGGGAAPAEAPPPPPQWAPPQGGARLRCLDQTHGQPCSRCVCAAYRRRGSPPKSLKNLSRTPPRLTPLAARPRSCTPAPPREAVGFYNLVGDPGRKNGEKKLKHMILRTPEWASPHARAQLVRPPRSAQKLHLPPC
jgi:hypothetical protein